MSTKLKFNGDLWRFKSLEDFFSYRDLFEYIKNQDAMNQHTESFEYFCGEPELHPSNSEQELKDNVKESISSSLDHFGSLTVVSLCTTYEVSVKEFLSCIFFYNPEYMFNYLGTDESKGDVNLKEILRASSHEELIINLAKTSSSKASKGRYGDVLRKISKLCGENQDIELSDKLNDLQSERNSIVHDKLNKSWSCEQIQDREEIISASLELLCRFGEAK